MSKVGEYYRELGILNEAEPEQDYIYAQKNKNFLYGFASACIIMLLSGIFMSCSVTTLEASGSNCGESSWNPCYVKIVE